MPICGPRSETSPCPVSFRLCGLSAAAPLPRAGWAQRAPRTRLPHLLRPHAHSSRGGPAAPPHVRAPGPRRHPGPRRARAGTAPAWCPAPRPAPCPARSAPGYSPPGEAGPAAGCPSTWPRLCAPEPAAGAPQRPASRRERPPPAPGPAPRQPRPRAAAAAPALLRAAPGLGARSGRGAHRARNGGARGE